jgi:hypothetical protein
MDGVVIYMNTSKTIWYMHHYAGSPSLGMAFRPYYLSREFDNNGYKSYIIGSSFHHLLHSKMEQKDQLSHRVIDDQNFIFLKTPFYYGNGIKRLINMFTYAWKVWRYQKKLIKITGVPSVIIASSAHPFHYIPAYWMAKKYNAKIIFEVRDLWPKSLTELLNISSYHPIILLLKWIEKTAYKKSDYVVSLLPNAKAYMTQNGLKPERFVYISNGVAAEDIVTNQQAIPEHVEQIIIEKRKQGFFLIGYTGAHGEPNAMDDLLYALTLLKKENYNKVHFILVGTGNLKEELKKYSLKNDLGSLITFLDALPKNQVLSFLEQMDATYIGWKNKSIYQYGISPNKIFDYMIAAKPILHAFSSSNDIVNQTQSGLSVEAENHKDIAKGIKTLVNKPNVELQAMGLRGKEAVLSSFTYKYLAKKYMDLFQ